MTNGVSCGRNASEASADDGNARMTTLLTFCGGRRGCRGKDEVEDFLHQNIQDGEEVLDW